MLVPTIVTFLLSGFVVLLASRFISGVRVDGYGTALLVAGIYALLATLFRGVLSTLAWPVVVLTFGAFMLVINAFLLWVTDKILTGFQVRGLTALGLTTVWLTIGDVLVDLFVAEIWY